MCDFNLLFKKKHKQHFPIPTTIRIYFRYKRKVKTASAKIIKLYVLRKIRKEKPETFHRMKSKLSISTALSFSMLLQYNDIDELKLIKLKISNV